MAWAGRPISYSVSRTLNRDVLLRGWTAPPSTEPLKFPEFVAGQGAELVDADGRRYLDAKSLMFNVSFGHGMEEIAQAAAKQLSRLPYVPTMDGHHNTVAEQLASRLVDLAPARFGQCYLSTSGTAAVEVAVMLARTFFRLRGQPDKNVIVALDHGYHGQSMAMTAVSGPTAGVADIAPTLPGCTHIPTPNCYRCPWGKQPEDCASFCAGTLKGEFERIGKDRVAAVVVEPVLSSVCQAPPEGFMSALRAACDDCGALLIADEVITALGRVGSTYASEAMGMRADMVCLSKALCNGALPIGATLITSEVWREFSDHEHWLNFGSTQDGNPTCAAAALATLDVFEREDWSRRSIEVGAYLLQRLRDGLADISCVGDVRGLGLLIGVELVVDRASREPLEAAGELCSMALEHGLLLHFEGNVIAIAPPLCLSLSQADRIADGLGAVIRRWHQSKRAKQ